MQIITKEWTQYIRSVALALQINQLHLPMQPNEENRFDTHQLHESIWPCLAGCPLFENAPERSSLHEIRWI